MNEQEYQDDTRLYAIDLVNEGLIDPKKMLFDMLRWFSNHDIREFLDKHELSPEDINGVY